MYVIGKDDGGFDSNAFISLAQKEVTIYVDSQYITSPKEEQQPERISYYAVRKRNDNHDIFDVKHVICCHLTFLQSFEQHFEQPFENSKLDSISA